MQRKTHYSLYVHKFAYDNVLNNGLKFIDLKMRRKKDVLLFKCLSVCHYLVFET